MLSGELLIAVAQELEAFLLAQGDDTFRQGYEQVQQTFLSASDVLAFKQKHVVPLKEKATGIHDCPLDIFYRYVRLSVDKTTCHFDSYGFMGAYNALLKKGNSPELAEYKAYIKWAINTLEGRAVHETTPLFKFLRRYETEGGKIIAQRRGLSLTGIPFTRTALNTPDAAALDEASLCLKCHKRGKDSCRTGLRDRKNPDVIVENARTPLSGCPVDQKISEMMVLLEEGYILGALAVILLDNPLALLTGHRICYDCVNSCIFQTLQGIDIPYVETHIINMIMCMPSGFHIYELLIRWNPLNTLQPLPLPPSNKDVLVVGSGPAGLGAAHYLMRSGHNVVLVDGAKIVPLPNKVLEAEDITDVRAFVEENIPHDAFGGVANYGITDRWDKVKLKLVRLLMERHPQLLTLGGVRFGTTLTTQQAFEDYNFSHVVLATGAGQPATLGVENSLIPQARHGSDFLMTANLYSPEDINALTNFPLRLPIMVVGGGLTAIDTATEALNYYVKLCKKIHYMFTKLEQADKLHQLKIYLRDEDCSVLRLYKHHGSILAEEEKKAAAEKREPRFDGLIKTWGGITVIYRGSLAASPSYNINYPEIQQALNLGVDFIENATISRIKAHKKTKAVKEVVLKTPTGKEVFRVGTLLQAIGIQPNTVVAEDEPGQYNLEQHHLEPLSGLGHDFFVSQHAATGGYVSALGDLHPRYNGSVVKALASAKDSIKVIHQAVQRQPAASQEWEFKRKWLQEMLQPVVTHVEEGPKAVWFNVKAPQAAKNFKPGEVFKLERLTYKGNQFKDNGLAISGLTVDETSGEISFRLGFFSPVAKNYRNLKVGEPLYMMGPTGSTVPLDENDNVLLVGEGYGLVYVSAFADYCKRKGIPHRVCNNSFNFHFFEDLSMYNKIIVMGPIDFLKEYYALYEEDLYEIFPPEHKIYANLHMNLQCMMKKICGQCLCTVKQPDGSDKKVFACSQTDYDLTLMPFDELATKAQQNSALNKFMALWRDVCEQ